MEQETFFRVCFALVTWSTSTEGVMRHCLELFRMLLLRLVQRQWSKDNFQGDSR